VSSSTTMHSRNADVASSRPMPSRPIARRKERGEGGGAPGDGGRAPRRGSWCRARATDGFESSPRREGSPDEGGRGGEGGGDERRVGICRTARMSAWVIVQEQGESRRLCRSDARLDGPGSPCENLAVRIGEGRPRAGIRV
jgi:hypothetical protein